MNSAGLISMNIVNNVDIFKDSSILNTNFKE